jgi:hypothetical protein
VWQFYKLVYCTCQIFITVERDCPRDYCRKFETLLHHRISSNAISAFGVAHIVQLCQYRKSMNMVNEKNFEIMID